MPRKKVNDNIIGARWQGIRLHREYIAVNRRIGGLEKLHQESNWYACVNRRIGGLEILHQIKNLHTNVNRRIDGLEI